MVLTLSLDYHLIICDTLLLLKHKRLQVDTAAYSALRDCIYEGDFDTCEAVPSGDSSGFLINPIAGFGIDLAGAARWVASNAVKAEAGVRSLLTRA